MAAEHAIAPHMLERAGFPPIALRLRASFWRVPARATQATVTARPARAKHRRKARSRSSTRREGGGKRGPWMTDSRLRNCRASIHRGRADPRT